MRITVDKNKCVGGGQCVRAAATVFSQGDEDGLVILLQDNPARSLADAVQDAARLCPASAISVQVE